MATLDETLKTLVENASALRHAGFTRVRVGDVELELRPAEAIAPSVGAEGAEEKSYADPFADPALYGRSDRAPGFDPPTDD